MKENFKYYTVIDPDNPVTIKGTVYNKPTSLKLRTLRGNNKAKLLVDAKKLLKSVKHGANAYIEIHDATSSKITPVITWKPKKQNANKAKTVYIYKGKKIDHLEFLGLMRRNGIGSGYRVSHAEHLKNLAAKGNKKAQEILNNLVIKKE